MSFPISLAFSSQKEQQRERAGERKTEWESEAECGQLSCLCSCLSYLSNLCKFPAYHAKHVELRLILLPLGNSQGITLSPSLSVSLSLCLLLPPTLLLLLCNISLPFPAKRSVASSNNLYKYLFLLPIFIFRLYLLTLPLLSSLPPFGLKGVKFNTTKRWWHIDTSITPVWVRSG